MALPDRIYLTGFMAAGKSTIGKILANTIGYNFIDLDQLIVDQEGQSVVDIFRLRGEQTFRDIETRTLQSLSETGKTIISLGGGTVCFNQNLDFILENGLLVYIKVKPKQLLYRIRSRASRPMFLDANGNILPDEEIRKKIISLMDERCPYYDQAHVTVETDMQPVGVVVDRLKFLLESWQGPLEKTVIRVNYRRKPFRRRLP